VKTSSAPSTAGSTKQNASQRSDGANTRAIAARLDGRTPAEPPRRRLLEKGAAHRFRSDRLRDYRA
jgi:hypothetical protein